MEARKRTRTPKEQAPETSSTSQVYDQDTPRWRRYYQQVRKRIRFPRYYKKQLNW